MIAAAAGLLLMGAAGGAAAQTAHPRIDPQVTFTTRDMFAPDLNQWGPSVSRRTLQWDSAKARWGVKLDFDSQIQNGASYRDVQAGAYYKVTPSFRVGGAVNLGSMNDQTPQAVIPADRAPKIKLETALKF